MYRMHVFVLSQRYNHNNILQSNGHCVICQYLANICQISTPILEAGWYIYMGLSALASQCHTLLVLGIEPATFQLIGSLPYQPSAQYSWKEILERIEGRKCYIGKSLLVEEVSTAWPNHLIGVSSDQVDRSAYSTLPGERGRHLPSPCSDPQPQQNSLACQNVTSVSATQRWGHICSVTLPQLCLTVSVFISLHFIFQSDRTIIEPV